MAKTKTAYRCTECGAEHSKWQGRCDTCGEWNTLVEETLAPKLAAAGASAAHGRPANARRGRQRRRSRPSCATSQGSSAERWATGIDEFDFVLGGGIVPDR